MQLPLRNPPDVEELDSVQRCNSDGMVGFKFPTSGWTDLTIRSNLHRDEHRYGHTAIHIIQSNVDAVTLEVRTCDQCVRTWEHEEIQLDSSRVLFEFWHCCLEEANHNPVHGPEIKLVVPRNFQGGTLNLSGFNRVEAVQTGPEWPVWKPFRVNVDAESIRVVAEKGRIRIKDCNTVCANIQAKKKLNVLVGSTSLYLLAAAHLLAGTYRGHGDAQDPLWELNARTLRVKTWRGLVYIRQTRATLAQIQTRAKKITLKDVTVEQLTAKAIGSPTAREPRTIILEDIFADSVVSIADDTFRQGRTQIRDFCAPRGNVTRRGTARGVGITCADGG
ncbi:hypothetical protein DFH07DRAFT_779772 [Mycena maculata]|uniref:Uncharacterized protein n=1 Tax=Mycena maculata TaxID=230809 RepID=A0AAD7I7N8_9AGAR|nr:hypothetical protein DFH07DRAFT_779772 [Mycena maculata]